MKGHFSAKIKLYFDEKREKGLKIVLMMRIDLKRGVANLTVILQHRQGIVEYLSIKDLVSCAFCKDEDA